MQYLLKLLKICNIIMNMQYTYNPLSILITNYCFFAEGKFLGAPCVDTCSPKLHHVYCNVRTKKCECEGKYPVKINPYKGCSKRKLSTTNYLTITNYLKSYWIFQRNTWAINAIFEKPACLRIHTHLVFKSTITPFASANPGTIQHLCRDLQNEFSVLKVIQNICVFKKYTQCIHRFGFQ